MSAHGGSWVWCRRVLKVGWLGEGFVKKGNEGKEFLRMSPYSLELCPSSKLQTNYKGFKACSSIT